MNKTLKDHLRRLVQLLLVTCLVVGLTPPLTVKADAPVGNLSQTDTCSQNFLPSRSFISGPLAQGNALYFFVKTAENFSLWKTDGTQSGTGSIYSFTDDLQPYVTENGNPITIFSPEAIENNRLIFYGQEGASAPELFSIDLGAETLAPLKLTTQAENLLKISDVFQGSYYFIVQGATSDELWRSDGTLIGTQLVKEFDSYFIWMELPFIGTTNGLWFLNNETDTLSHLISSPGNYTYEVLGEQKTIVFVDGFANLELWVTDGTPSGTQLLKTFTNESSYRSTHNNSLVFFPIYRNNSYDEDDVLWQTDGTVEGTKITDADFTFSNIGHFFSSGDLILAHAGNNSDHWVVSVHGADEGGIQILGESEYGWSNGYFNFVKFNEKIYFLDRIETVDYLFSLEDEQITPIELSTERFYLPDELIASRLGFLMFPAASDFGDQTLFISDGTKAGTKILFSPEDSGYSFLSTYDTLMGNYLFIREQYYGWDYKEDHLHACYFDRHNLFLPSIIR